MIEFLTKIARYALAAVGGGTVAVSDDMVMQAVGAVVTVAGVVWSIVNDRLKAKAAQ